MPLIDPQSQEEWDSHYSGGYTRANADLWAGLRHDVPLLCDALRLDGLETVILFGAGFGFEAEIMQERGINVVCVDPNRHIQAFKNREARLPILPSCNRGADWAITLDAMPWLSDLECIGLGDMAGMFAPQVAHWVTCVDSKINLPELGNWKTQGEWKALLTPDLVVRRSTDMVL